MSRSWLSIRVELVEGRGEDYWPRPGRTFAAARSHTFGQLATAIDDAFTRWDRAHLHQFWMASGPRIGQPDIEEDLGEDILDERRLTLGRLTPCEQFAYEFDFGDSWVHLCTVAERRVDPLETLGLVPVVPLAYWGWGDVPDQYGRRWDGDDGQSPLPTNPKGSDLPELGPWRWRRR